MDFDDSSSSSSSSCDLSTICSTSTSGPSPKRKAGRRKFRETRHPMYHGVRERNGGRWVCEVREPQRKGRIWLGTFLTPEMAARAHDVAAIALRGSSAQLNFPDSAWALPRAKSTAPDDVRRAAAEAVEMIPPSNSSPPSSTAPPAGQSTAAGITPPGRDGVEAGALPPAPVLVDEEALFSMPGLLEDMERGLLVTPPSMGVPPAAPVLVDEEALFNMPGLLEDMARGLLVTPPSMLEGFDGDGVDECLMDLSLW
ncbi:unnamed protein product [Musa acuminata var. zebrina]